MRQKLLMGIIGALLVIVGFLGGYILRDKIIGPKERSITAYRQAQTTGNPSGYHWQSDPFVNPGFGEWDPFQEMDRIQNVMNRTFRDSFSRGVGAAGLGSLSRNAFYEPDLDVKETGTHYIVRLDLPGIEKDKINLKVQNNMLTISGERSTETENEGSQGEGSFHRIERSFGSFMRTIPLPFDASAEGITAESKNGVVTIQIPKTGANKSTGKAISIQ